jgi:hypothetical protein
MEVMMCIFAHAVLFKNKERPLLMDGVCGFRIQVALIFRRILPVRSVCCSTIRSKTTQHYFGQMLRFSMQLYYSFFMSNGPLKTFQYDTLFFNSLFLQRQNAALSRSEYATLLFSYIYPILSLLVGVVLWIY